MPSTNQSVSIDIPLLIRIFEFIREDLKNEKDIPLLVQNIQSGKILSMNDYESIIDRIDTKLDEMFDMIDRLNQIS